MSTLGTATPAPVVATRRPTQRATQWVLAGSLASGIGALVFQVLGVDVLGEEAYAPITVLWTLQYLASTIALYSAEAYVTRAATLHPGEPRALDRPVRVIAVWVAALALACGIVTWLLRDALFAGAGDLAVVAAALILSYGAFFVIKGRMAGANRFRSYGAATALESVGRILLALPVLLVLPSTRALAWVMPLGPALVAAWWSYDRTRGDAVEDPETAEAPSAGAAGRFLAATTLANTASQTLLAAGPLVLIPLGALPAEQSLYFITITAARVPLVFALGGLMSRVLPPLTRLASAGGSAQLRRIALLVVPASLGVALVGAALGAVVGPTLIDVVFRTQRPDAIFVALTAFGVLLATGSLVLNQLLIARGLEHRLVAPWLTALAAAVVAALLTTGTATFRVSVGFAVGEVVALAGLLAANLLAGHGGAHRVAPAAPAAAPLGLA